MTFIYLHMYACVHATVQLLGVVSLLLASGSWDSDLGRQGSATSSYSLSHLLGSLLSIFYLHYVMNMFFIKKWNGKKFCLQLGQITFNFIPVVKQNNIQVNVRS